MMKFELPTYSNQKSYYGKATVCILDNGNIQLQSYDTIVCGISPDFGFLRLWNDYSVTTMKHINSFRAMYNLPPLTKKEWEALPIA